MNVNFTSRVNCNRCGSSKDDASRVEPFPEGSKWNQRDFPGTSPGDWRCLSCRKVNYHHDSLCFRCKRPAEGNKEVCVSLTMPTVRPPPAPTEWRCKACGMDNYLSRSKCMKCYTARPLKKGHYICPKCDFLNFADRKTCKKCDDPRPLSAGPALDTEATPGSWKCARCQKMNFRSRFVCFSCKYAKDEKCDVIQDPSGKPLPNVPGAPGDWKCLTCKKINFKTNHNFCNRCKTPRKGNFELIV